ncbi:hypothetical protein DES53_102697 [Roseimicrobium gellanilyticum]|uniref:Cytochrome c domain-containing protein n=1 Tax=Roseimicrobium gellanilyticum TaxID=748857 RepID=A0A366HSS3_9BACT|nr:hypothetical protein [Roseimicrobium gellanilyticum]RBP46309.1 hypothetical protein DES53_102697 [Roseimicrobium gellanilyticum]
MSRDIHPPKWLPSCLQVIATLLVLTGAPVRGEDVLEDANWQASRDPVAMLWRRVAAGQTKLDTSSDKAFLGSLLRELDVPVESQVLVFSKTSLQKSLIGPATPRALYFNEECYIGWVQGGDVEVVSSEPGGDLQYYLIHRPGPSPAQPRLIRSNQCASCHVGGELQVQSVFTRPSGYPMGNEDRFVTSFESPLSERWGGWYVTGRHGGDFHMGNVTTETGPKGMVLDRKQGANLESLTGWFPVEPYLTGTSDLVALMVLEHQYVLHNALQDAARVVRRMLERKDNSDAPDEAARQRVVTKRAEKIVELLLFTGEYPLKDGGVAGGDAFQNAFRRNRKTSTHGASLKDFDLHSRIFTHRCSYMIHSATFKAMPQILKARVYALLDDALSGRGGTDYAHLDAVECQSIRQILIDTESEIRAAWASKPES